MAGPRGLGSSAPPPSVPASVWLGAEQEQAPCCSPTGHQAALLAAWTLPVVLETLGGALGRPEPTHVGRDPPLTTWPLSRVAQLLVFSRRYFRCTGVSRPRCDKAVPSVRQNPRAPRSPQRLHPGLLPDACRLSGSLPGVSAPARGQRSQDCVAGPQQGVCVGSQDCHLAPARGPLPWPLGVLAAVPLVTRQRSGRWVLRDLRPGLASWHRRNRRNRRCRHPSGHLDACVFWAPPRCPVPVRVERLGEAAGSLASHLCPWRDDSSPATEAYSLVGDKDWLPKAWDPRGIPVMMGERDTRVTAEQQA